MTTLLSIALMLSGPQQQQLPIPPRSWLQSLALVESGNDPKAVGRHGERTEYQIMPKVWRSVESRPIETAGSSARAGVVLEIWSTRIEQFRALRKRWPTEREGYMIWHRPARPTKPRGKELDRALRFENLVKDYEAAENERRK